MVNERAATAIARIERALVRIEANDGAQANGNDARRAFSELEARHGALKQELHRTIADLDAIISHSEAG